MSWMDWIAQNHSVFVHVPVAVGILLPLALVAAQRVGRGIRPWWVTCRYLGWFGLLFTFAAVFSGLLLARKLDLLAPGQWLAPAGGGNAAAFRLHQALGAGSFLLGVLTLRALFRRREDHQGLGFLPLVLGLAWAASALGAGWYGGHLTPQPSPAKAAAKPELPIEPAPLADPEGSAPLRALDYLSLVPMHPEPVRSALHGNRWIRVWVSPGAEAAYRAGDRLPEGSLLVMSSVEDRWGRPGVDAGPLYAMEMKKGKPQFTFYWPRVPAAKRGETAGAERAYWRDGDPNLSSCLTCHLDGLAPQKDRSTWVVPRKPKSDTPSVP